MAHEVAGFEGHAVGLEQRGNTLVHTTFGLAGFAVALLVVLARLGVGGNDTLKVAQDDLVGALRDDVLGHDGRLAAAAGGVDHEGGYGIAGGVAAQVLDDLDTLADGGAEVLETHGEVALVDIVGTHTVAHEFVHEFLHDVDAVVDAAQQHGLVAQRDAGVGQARQCLFGLGGELVGVVEVGVEPDGMVLLQHLAQLGGDALGADHGGAAAETDDLDMRDGAEALDDVLELLVGDHEAVAAAEQHVAHLRCALDVGDALLDALAGALVVLLAGETATGAVAAVHGAHVGDEEEHAVWIAVCEAGSGRVLILVQRVVEVGGGDVALFAGGDGLATDGVVGVVGVDKTQIIRRDGHTELGQSFLDTFGLFRGEGEILAQLFVGLDTILDLPFPVVPLFVGNLREQLFSAVDFHKDIQLDKQSLGLNLNV